MNVLNSKAAGYAVVALIAVGALYFLGKKLAGSAGDAARAVGQAVDPTSDKNLAYRGTNAIGEALTGDKDFTLGGWLYDITHPNEGAEIARTPGFSPRANQVRETASFFERLIGD